MKEHAGHGEPGRMMRAFRRVPAPRHALATMDRDRADGCPVRLVRLRPALRAAAVLPVIRPAGADRRLTLPQNSSIAETTEAQMDRFEKALAGDPDIEQLELLYRSGRGAVLLCLRRAARQRLLRPDRHRDQGTRRRATACGRGWKRCCARTSRHRRTFVKPWNSGRRSAGRSSTASADRISARSADAAQSAGRYDRRQSRHAAASTSTGTSRRAW